VRAAAEEVRWRGIIFAVQEAAFFFLWIAFSSLSMHAFFLLRDCATLSVAQTLSVL
jgi:hypothetical protein